MIQQYAVIVVLFGVLCVSGAVPTWPKSYQVNGLLRLPYAELEEPFTAFLDGKKNRSRIDFYGGTVKTIQLSPQIDGDYGQNYMVAPMTTETVLNKMSCFLVNGTADEPVSPQSVLPDLTGFQFLGFSSLGVENCSTWQLVTKVGDKKNVYTLWVSVEQDLPLRYEMFGYDSLIGSHFDKYYVDYQNWVPNPSFPDETFQVPKEISCGDFPGPGDQHTSAMTMNPMHQYFNDDLSQYEQSFNSYKKLHNKVYQGDKEHRMRLHTYTHNVRYIHSKNRAGLGFHLSINHLADWSDEEMKILRGYRPSSVYNGGAPFHYKPHDIKDTPDQLDWRLYGAVTQVKDQATCGSCWSFGTTGAVEGALFMKTGELVRLSQQALMDCSWGEGNNACNGGEDFRAYQWIIKHGLPTEASYGPYLGQDGYCHSANSTVGAKMSSYVNVTSGDLQALRVASAKQGPISVSIDAAHKSLSFYSHGVYYEPDCGNSPDSLDHSVLLVGYGTMDGQDYWLIKNSWSTYWGNNGYVLMSQKNNNCGVATAATHVVM